MSSPRHAETVKSAVHGASKSAPTSAWSPKRRRGPSVIEASVETGGNVFEIGKSAAAGAIDAAGTISKSAVTTVKDVLLHRRGVKEVAGATLPPTPPTNPNRSNAIPAGMPYSQAGSEASYARAARRGRNYCPSHDHRNTRRRRERSARKTAAQHGVTASRARPTARPQPAMSGRARRAHITGARRGVRHRRQRAPDQARTADRVDGGGDGAKPLAEDHERGAAQVLPNVDQEHVASLAIDAGVSAVPVVDAAGHLLGCVPAQALIAILRREPSRTCSAWSVSARATARRCTRSAPRR